MRPRLSSGPNMPARDWLAAWPPYCGLDIV